MYLACSTLSFDELPLAVAAERIGQLGFDALELGCIDQWAHVSPWDLVEDRTVPVRQLKQIQQDTETRVIGLNCGYQLRRPEQEQTVVETLCAFARELGVGIVTIAAPEAQVPVSDAVRQLQRLVKAAGQMGRTLCVETHLGRLTETPSTTMSLLEQVPDLGLTLDASHYVARGLAETEWRTLYPRVRHVHLRDAGGAQRLLQTRMGQGDMPFEAVLGGLQEAGYQGAVVIEYLRPEKLGLGEDYPMLPELTAA